MTEIKRYEMNHRGLPSADHTGTWVLHEDHAAIVAEKDARIAALQEQVRALAAEVSECRRFVVEELGPESGIQFTALSTERSDEVLRETRAQAVEGFAKHLRSHMQDGSPLGLLAIGADEFAEKIRAGGQP